MNAIDKTAPSQTESIAFEFDLHHSPEKVWRALTDPVLLAEWLLPVVDLKLEPGAAFTFNAPVAPADRDCADLVAQVVAGAGAGAVFLALNPNDR